MFSRIFYSGRRIPSVGSCLKTFLTRRQAQAVFKATSDARLHIIEATRVTPFSEEELTRQVANRMNIPFLLRIPALDPSLLESRINLEALERIGGTLLAAQAVVTGVVVVCPRFAEELIRVFPGRTVYLGTWSAISDVLAQAKRSMANLETAAHGQVSSGDEVASEVLRLLVAEACSYGATEVDVRPHDARLQYRFVSKDGRVGQGFIQKEVAQRCLRELGRLAVPESGSSLRNVIVNGAPVRLRVVVLPDGTFRICRELPDSTLVTAAQVTVRSGVSPVFIPPTVSPSSSGVQSAASLQGETEPEPIGLEASHLTSQLSQRSEPASRVIVPLQPPVPGETVIQHDFEGSPIAEVPNAVVDAVVVDPYVLLVEDCVQFAALLIRMLAKEGLKVLHAQSGSEGLALLQQEKSSPALCICDLHMPVMNGFGFLKALRNDPRHRALSVIMLTSDADEEVQVRGLEHGADAFIGKGEHPSILLAHVRRYVQRELRRAA